MPVKATAPEGRRDEERGGQEPEVGGGHGAEAHRGHERLHPQSDDAQEQEEEEHEGEPDAGHPHSDVGESGPGEAPGPEEEEERSRRHREKGEEPKGVAPLGQPAEGEERPGGEADQETQASHDEVSPMPSGGHRGVGHG